MFCGSTSAIFVYPHVSEVAKYAIAAKFLSFIDILNRYYSCQKHLVLQLFIIYPRTHYFFYTFYVFQLPLLLSIFLNTIFCDNMLIVIPIFILNCTE